MNWLSAMCETGDLVSADEVLEVGLHLARALVAIVAVLRERAHDDGLEVRRVVGPDVARARVLALADQLERLVLARALEEALARRELEEHDAGREDVAARVDRLAARLLGRHVRDLALELPALRLLADAGVSLFAMPKSTIFTSPVNVTTMFCGEMSRWTMLSGVPSRSRFSCA